MAKRRNTYPRWLYYDANGEKKVAYTRAEARRLNQAKHKYALEYQREKNPSDYQKEVVRLAPPPRVVRGRIYPTVDVFDKGWPDYRTITNAQVREMVRYQQSVINAVYSKAWSLGENDRIVLYLQLQDAVREVARKGAFTGRWFELARDLYYNNDFQQDFAMAAITPGETWHYWAKSDPNYEPIDYLDQMDEDFEYEEQLEGYDAV